MKSGLLGVLLAILTLSPAFAEPFVPPVGEGRPIPLTVEQRAGETAAAARKHEAILQTAVESAHEHGQKRLEVLLRRLLIEGSVGDKAAFAASHGNVYDYPARLAAETHTATFRPAFDRGIECRATRCVQYQNEQVCNNRSYCRVVCQATAGGVGGAIGGRRGGAIGGAASGEVCSQVCELAPECRTVSTCLQYEYSGAGCF